MPLQYLLDTNTCIYIINRRPPEVAQQFARHAPDAVGISSLTLAELSYGARKSGSTRNQFVLEAFILPLEVVPFDLNHAWRYGEVRAALERAGTPIGPLDTLIASHALTMDITLVTHNVREFKRVDGLRLENWFPLPDASR